MATLDRKYVYKISRNGIYLGVLQNVVSEFTYSQDIGTGSAALTIMVGSTPDRQFEATEAIQTEDGQSITNELGAALLIERQPDIVGNANSLALMRNNNDIAVYEVSPNYPNGKLVFSGWISRWKANFGVSDTITISCLSNGSELDNYLIQGTPNGDQSQLLSDSYYQGYSYGKPAVGAKIYQQFTVGATVPNLYAIDFKLYGNTSADVGLTLQLDIYSSQSDAQNGINSLATVQQNIQSTSPTVQKFTLPNALTVNAGASYFARLTSLDNIVTNFNLAYQSTAPYASGIVGYSDGSVGGVWTTLAGDLYFQTYYTAGATSSPFTGQDPTTMVRSIIDSYVSRGGSINYATGTTVLTNTTRSYTFKINTILEGIKKCQELSPYDWYWYVDVATNTLYFKETSTTADLTLVYGRHIESLDIEAVVENAKNQVYFTGGDTGGNVYLYTSQSDVTALAANAGRVGLARLTDNRVLLTDTASALMLNYLNNNKNEVYNTSVRLNADTYDVHSIALGMVMGFKGFGSFVDNLLLQVVHREIHSDYAIFGLGVLLRRASTFVEDINRALNDVETIYNPTTPS